MPAIRALAAWGLEYATRTPAPGEPVYPENAMSVLSITLNHRGLRVSRPVKWTISFAEKGVYTIIFDGKEWSVEPVNAPDADVRVETSPEIWVAFMQSAQDERARLLNAMCIMGEESHVNEMLAFNWKERHAVSG